MSFFKLHADRLLYINAMKRAILLRKMAKVKLLTEFYCVVALRKSGAR